MSYLMVAPNGARRGKKDHPALPLTIDEIAQTAAACYAAGADAIHAHIRDKDGKHTLDAGLYRELIAAVADKAPAMPIQITTESAGCYAPDAQRRLLYDLRPAWASVSLAEMLSDGNEAAGLYHWAVQENVRLQHILYTADEVALLRQLMADGIVPHRSCEVLFVLGRYAPAVSSTVAMLDNFLAAFAKLPAASSFMVCAFGQAETNCLTAAAAAGGDCRVGFENNLYNACGGLATDNAERVAEVAALLKTATG